MQQHTEKSLHEKAKKAASPRTTLTFDPTSAPQRGAGSARRGSHALPATPGPSQPFSKLPCREPTHPSTHLTHMQRRCGAARGTGDVEEGAPAPATADLRGPGEGGGGRDSVGGVGSIRDAGGKHLW